MGFVVSSPDAPRPCAIGWVTLAGGPPIVSFGDESGSVAFIEGFLTERTSERVQWAIVKAT